MKAHLSVAAAILVGLSTTSFARADAQAAKDYVKQAQDLVDQKDIDGAKAKLELANTELDGVDADTKSPIAASIKAIQDSIASTNHASDVEKYHRKLGTVMDAAEGSIGNQVTWPGAAAAVKEVFDDPAAQAAIPDELAAAKKKFATFDKLSSQKTSVAVGGEVDDAIKELNAKWAENKPKFTDPNSAPGDKSSAVETMTREIDSAKQQIARLPAGSDAAKTDTDAVAKVSAEFAQLGLADKAKDVLARQKDYLDGYKKDFDGWEQETGDGPSWSDYQHQQNDTIEAFNAPKTRAFISRIDEFFKDLNTNDDYKPVADSPDMKAFVDARKSDRSRAYAQMLKHVNSTVTAALSTGGEELSKLKDGVRLALGEDSPEGKTLQDSIQKKIDGATAAASSADDAQKAWYTKMTAAANAAWPDISSKFTPVEGFDPNDFASFKGKIIKITTSNLMGYRFMPGDFDFATTLGGMPIAGRFDPSIKSAVKDIEAKMGRGLGDSDDDGKWEVFAIVTGAKGRMMQRKQAEGDVKVDGETVGKVTGEYQDPVEAPIINVIAGKCGPFAGGAGATVLKPDGKLAAAPAAAGISGGSSTLRNLFLLVVFGLAIAAVVLHRQKRLIPLLTTWRARGENYVQQRNIRKGSPQ